MKLGIFGGTFNPPHNTHLRIVQQAYKQLGLDKVLVIPCGDPPHKVCGVDKYSRLQMARLAFDGIAETWDYEINKQCKSYTVETLREVKRLYLNAELYLIIGGDSFVDFDKWYCPEQIAALCTLVIADRKGQSLEEAESRLTKRYGLKTAFLDFTPDSVSSTEIRLRYQFGDNVDCVPKAVDEYIKRNGLYAEYRNMAVKLKSYLKPQRFQHTFYVVKRGLEFASESDYDKVFAACLLHDCAKYVDEADYAKYGFVKPCDMPNPVVHSFLGAKVAQIDFGVTDPEILDAITYHTTGRPNMSRLDKIVYIADKTEQTRPYPLEHLLVGTLDDMFIKCLAEANEYREQARGDTDFALTDLTLKFYRIDK